MDHDDARDWLGLEGRRVLVAGAGGIGTACAVGYARQGAEVLVVDRDRERLSELADRSELRGAKVRTLAADLAGTGSGARVVAAALEELGGLDVLLHSIGVNDRRPVLDLTEDDWNRVLDANLGTAFGIVQAAGRHMTEHRHGHIVLLSSVSGLLAHRHHAPYAASKGAMNQMLRVMAAEWAADGVTVNAVAPGYVETALTAHHLAEPGVRDGLVRLVPAGRLGTPDEIVGPVLMLSSDRAGFVTGQVLYVDGGRTLV